jgi:hypothetical protein
LFYTGERLYSLIHDACAPLTGKITGMLLELDNLELLLLLESPESLHAKAGGDWVATQQRPRAVLEKIGQLTSICWVLVEGSQLQSGAQIKIWVGPSKASGQVAVFCSTESCPVV